MVKIDGRTGEKGKDQLLKTPRLMTIIHTLIHNTSYSGSRMREPIEYEEEDQYSLGE